MTFKELCQKTNIPPTTVYYWELRNLLPPRPPRTVTREYIAAVIDRAVKTGREIPPGSATDLLNAAKDQR